MMDPIQGNGYQVWTARYGTVNVKDFGAVGDGVHDDTAAIQAAIDALKDGGVVVLPSGQYFISNSIAVNTDGIRICGAVPDNQYGNGTQILNGSATTDVFAITAGQITVEGLTIAQAKGVTPTSGWALNITSGEVLVRRVWIYGTYGGAQLSGAGVDTVRFEDCRVRDVVGPESFYLINASDGVEFIGVIIESNTGSNKAIVIDTGSGTVRMERVGINGCLQGIVTTNSQAGTPPANIMGWDIEVDGIPVANDAFPFYFEAGESFFFDSLWTDGGYNNLYVGPSFGGGLEIVNSQLTYAERDGIYVANAASTYSLNLLLDNSAILNAGNSANNTYSGINIVGGVEDFIVRGCTFATQTASSAAYAVRVGGGCNYFRIVDNDVRNQANPQLLNIGSTGGVQQISGNIGYNPVGSLNPPASPLESATVYQNTSGVTYTIYQPAYATTSGTAGTVSVALGATNTPSTLYTEYVYGGTSNAAPQTLPPLRVPPGWYYSFTATGATLLNAQIQGD